MIFHPLLVLVMLVWANRPSCGQGATERVVDETTNPSNCHETIDEPFSISLLQDIDPYLHKLLDRLHTKEFYINGSWVSPYHQSSDWQVSNITTNRTKEEEENGNCPSVSSPRLSKNLVDPSTGQVFAFIALGQEADTNRAVQAAHAAYPQWSLARNRDQRQALVQRLLNLMRLRQTEMAHVISREMGSPIDVARTDQVGAGLYQLETSLNLYEDYFDHVRTLPNVDDYNAAVQDGDGTTILMHPIGVVGAITPWNWPLNQITIKIIPALLVGCTVVLKPSEQSPLSALILAELVHEAGFPPGVFNLLNGLGPVVGQQLSSHPLVDMVSFTGSTRAGAAVSRAAADSFKKVTLELGGKGALIIFDDIGEEWIQEILPKLLSDFENSGQSCDFAGRILVHRSLYDRAVQAAQQVAETTKVASAHVSGMNHIGPVANQVQYERIQSLIQSGLDQGATLVAGGLGKPTALKDSPGFFVRPTVFADCTPEMDIFQQEIFGPVICLTPFDTEQDAIALANDSFYGLSHYVNTRSGPRRRRLAHALKAGQIHMNDFEGDIGTPFGGMRASGIGREGGLYGLEEFCEIKSVMGYHDSSEDLTEVHDDEEQSEK